MSPGAGPLGVRPGRPPGVRLPRRVPRALVALPLLWGCDPPPSRPGATATITVVNQSDEDLVDLSAMSSCDPVDGETTPLHGPLAVGAFVTVWVEPDCYYVHARYSSPNCSFSTFTDGALEPGDAFVWVVAGGDHTCFTE